MIAAVQQRVPKSAVHEDSLFEIVNGVRIEVPPMSVFSSIVNARIHFYLATWVNAHQLGFAVPETLFVLDELERQQRRPDTAYVSKSKWPLDQPFPATGEWKVVPDLAIEVVSPSETFGEVLEKMHEFFEFGVAEVWIAAPLSCEIYVYTSPTENRIFALRDTLEGVKLLSGFRLPLSQIFQNAPPPAEKKNDV